MEQGDSRAAWPARRLLRSGMQRFLHWSGAGALYRARHPRPGAAILMYHSVPDAKTAPWIDPRSAVPVRSFARQMRFLARSRRVIALGELLERIDGGENAPAGTVVLTFDDGYRDNLTTAAEILADLQLPATLYVATGYVGRGETQWVDRLHAMFTHRSRDRLRSGDAEGEVLDLSRPASRRRAYLRLGERMIGLARAEREALLAEVAAQLAPTATPPRLTLDWDEVRALRRRHRGFEIGVHSRDHVDLVGLGETGAAREIDGCLEDARRELDDPVEHFSYPYGRSDAATRTAVARRGFRSAVVTEPSDLVRADSDRFALARFEAPRSLSLLRFLTSGAHPGLECALRGRS